jgi:L-2-hydroxyglutarate oxidase LhgO
VTGVTLNSGETFNAPTVINAAGPHAAKINRMAGVYDEMKVHHQPLRQKCFRHRHQLVSDLKTTHRLLPTST